MRMVAVCLLALLVGCGGGGDIGRVAPGNVVAEKIAPVAGPGRCGIGDAWRVTEVAGVRLSPPARLSERALTALDRWVAEEAIPAIGTRGGGLAEMRVAASYACRTRNSRRGARLSEHALGNAIDISTFVLRDGTRFTVLDDWNSKNRTVMRRLWASACGTFGTVLGPNSDVFHRDHFHFDVADYRNGAYCR